MSQRNRSWGTNHSLRSLGGLALGQNHSIQVVEIAGRIYVVGVGDSITLVDKIEDPEQVKSVIAALERQLEAGWSNNVVNHLLNKLKNRSERTNSEEPANEQWNSATSFQDLLQDKLNKQSDRKQQLESLLNNSKTNERLMDDEK
ncbi:Flagellar biosynthesis protein, FliO [compost metagenome]